MKLVFATADLPWETTTGARLRDLATYRALQAHAEVTLLSFPLWTPSATESSADGVRVYPAPLPRTFGGRVALRAAATLHGRLIFQEHLAQRGAFERLAATLRDTNADTLVAGFPIYDGFLPVARPLVKRLIVDLWELRSRGARQRLRSGGGVGRRARAALDVLATEKVEREVADYADEVWMVEKSDAARYGARYGLPVRVVPNTIDVATYAAYGALTRAPASICFVGTLDYDPNITAAVRLLERILPLLRRRRPNARLLLAGRRPARSIVALVERTPGATLLADVPDAIQLLAERGPLVAPIVSGTGTRLKILQAAASRVPVVATRTALEGLTFVPEREVVAADTDERFVDAITGLWDDPALAARLTDAAYERVVREYDIAVVRDIVGRALRDEPEPLDSTADGSRAGAAAS